VQPLALINAISEILPKDAVVIDESVSSSGGLRQLVKSDDPQSFFGLRGGGIGWGLPASIGVKIALPDRPVIALVGDGSAMYTCQALWTAARYKVGVVFVIFNNTSYRILKQRLFASAAMRAARQLCRHGAERAGDRLRRACALARRSGRPRQDRARRDRPDPKGSRGRQPGPGRGRAGAGIPVVFCRANALGMKLHRSVMIKMNEVVKNILLPPKHLMPYRHSPRRGIKSTELC
jgi:hypothetical protein